MKSYILSVLCCFLALSGAAQNTRLIKGRVFDTDGQGIAGAVLRIIGTDKETKASQDGSFSINVDPYAKELEASAFGYFPQKLEIDGSYMVYRLKRDKKAAQKAEAERAERIKAEQQETAKAEETARAEKAKAEAEAKAQAEAEAKAKANAERLKAAQEAKEKKDAERKAINDAHNQRFRNKGFTNTIEISYGYQTGVSGSVLYNNLGYQNYTTLHPAELAYQLGYRFNNSFSVGIGTGITYNCLNINSLHSLWKDSIYNSEAYTSTKRVDIPIYLNLKAFAGRGKAQPTASASIGIYACTGVLFYDLGAGCTFRISKSRNFYVLASLRSTPWPEYSRPQDINDASEPAFNGYKSALTPSIKIGFTL